ncbi:ABC transporter permease [Natrarchaeobaculum aegyptiacum]|uniref:ABC transporter permease n=1 Tax=Natrarchaeobaculum aegyptiacum TaxID=745377 RepID=A0A2Z2I0C2_9EURY|nr:ABC transporter permease [Natrarchaeobaculum aegyptiacum]ARS91837.1 ABC transporter permease [Natrarchaeobaculum aegyptiacum]
MTRYSSYLVAVALAVHGLIHFLGVVVYFELLQLADLPYKTTLLGGAVAVGGTGIRVFAVLTAVAGVGFLVSAVALVTNWRYWWSLLFAVTAFSLVLTALDWTVASMGVLANLAILVGLVGYRFRATVR